MLDISVQHSATVCRRSSEKLYRLSLKELNFEKLGLGFNGKISPYWNILKSCKLKDNYKKNYQFVSTNLDRFILGKETSLLLSCAGYNFYALTCINTGSPSEQQ